jgi:hypothetical protein
LLRPFDGMGSQATLRESGLGRMTRSQCQVLPRSDLGPAHNARSGRRLSRLFQRLIWVDKSSKESRQPDAPSPNCACTSHTLKLDALYGNNQENVGAVKSGSAANGGMTHGPGACIFQVIFRSLGSPYCVRLWTRLSRAARQ